MNDLLIKNDYLKEIKDLPSDYILGDEGHQVTQIKQWLFLWQFYEGLSLCDKLLANSLPVFDHNMYRAVKRLQRFFKINETGEVDQHTWQKMVFPMKAAFSLELYGEMSLSERVCFYAFNHLRFRPYELFQKNTGPWIRAYMGGKDGKPWAWCQGFICTILDQAFSSMNKYFTSYYPDTVACREMHQAALDSDLLITNDQLQKGTYTPQPGDMFQRIDPPDQKAHHTGIIVQVFNDGHFYSIEGNTNFAKAREGVGCHLLHRNYLTSKNIDIVQLIKY